MMQVSRFIIGSSLSLKRLTGFKKMGAFKRKKIPCQRFMTPKMAVFHVTNMLHKFTQLFSPDADTQVYMGNTTTSKLPPAPPAHNGPVSGQELSVATSPKIEKTEILDLLSQCEAYVTGITTLSRARLAAMRDDETSYFNFVSAENTLGLSAWWLDRPASSFRYDAARRYVSALDDIRFNLYAIRAQIEDGEFSLAKPAAQIFLNSPVGRAVDWKTLLNNNGPTPSRHLLYIDVDALAHGLVSLANRCESDDMAILTAKSFKNLLGERSVNRMLPDTSVVLWNEYGRDVINATVSLPQMLGYVSGVGIGVMVARSAQATKASLTALTAVGRGRYLLPGASLMRTTVAGTWNSHWLTRGLANFGFSMVQFQVYAGIGYLIAGRNGIEVAGAVFMGGLGTAAGFANGWVQRLAAELAAKDSSGTLAQWLLKDAMPPYARVSLSVEMPAVERANSFRLVTAKDARTSYDAMTTFQQELIQAEQVQAQTAAAAAQQAAQEQHRLAAIAQREAAKQAKAAQKAAQRDDRMKIQIQDQLKAIQTITSTLPESEAPRVLQEAQTAAAGADLPAALAALRKTIDTLKANAAAAKKPTPLSNRAVTPQAQPAATKPGTRATRTTDYIPAKLPRDVKALAETPPDQFDDVLEALHSQIFSIDASCMPSLTALYNTGDAGFKRQVIVRLGEINSANPNFGTPWSAMRGTENRIWEGSLGTTHKIMIRKKADTFLNGPIWTVVSIRPATAKIASPMRVVTPPSLQQ
jgi:hypothetical protein